MGRTGEQPNYRVDAILLHLHLDDSEKCWDWTWRVNPHGYGEFSYSGVRGAKAHRIIYEDLVGPIPQGYELHHECENRRCVNPSHLRPVTKREHTLLGNTWSGRNLRKTHCHRGHALTEDNVKIEDGYRRRCKTCAKANRDAARSRLRADFAAGRITVTHGTSTAYCNYGCRCDLCRDWRQQRAASLAWAQAIEATG